MIKIEKYEIRTSGKYGGPDLYGVFRRGNNPPVLPGEGKRAKLQKGGRAKSKPEKTMLKEEPLV